MECIVSYPDPDSHSCGWITSPLRDVIHPQLWESGSGYETMECSGNRSGVLKPTLLKCSYYTLLGVDTDTNISYICAP